MPHPKKTLKIIFLAFLVLLVLAGLFLAYLAIAKKEPAPAPEEATLKDIVIKYDNKSFETTTQASTVAEALAEQNITPGEEDYLFPVQETPITAGTVITLQSKIPIKIEVDGATLELKTFTETVEDALEEAGVTLSHLDKVEPQKTTRVSRDLDIVVTRINIEEVTEKEVVEFTSIKKEDSTLRWRRTKTQQAGENGLRETTYRLTYKNGELDSKEKLKSKVTQKPKDEIVLVGTKIEVGKVSKGRASWYHYTGSLACASLEHPKGTWLKVTNRANGKSVIVQVNDSGPYSKDKIIDLDAVAFRRLGDLGSGVIDVKVEEILE